MFDIAQAIDIKNFKGKLGHLFKNRHALWNHSSIVYKK